MKPCLLILSLALLAAPLCHAGESGHPSSDREDAGVAALSPGLRDLLAREMVLLQEGMTGILPLYVSGKWDEIAEIAGKMENSYILKQSLSDEQAHELHTTLPDGFIELDRQFHYYSGMLGHAAAIQKAELAGFYLYKMNEACLDCHARYATHRFPALARKHEAHQH